MAKNKNVKNVARTGASVAENTAAPAEVVEMLNTANQINEQNRAERAAETTAAPNGWTNVETSVNDGPSNPQTEGERNAPEAIVNADGAVIDAATGDVLAQTTTHVESESATGIVINSTVRQNFHGTRNLFGNPGTATFRDIMAFPQWNVPRCGRLDHLQEAPGIAIIDSMIVGGYSPNFSLTCEPWDDARHAKPYAIAREMYLTWLDLRIAEADAGKGIDTAAAARAAKEWFIATYQNKDKAWRTPKLVVIDGNTRFAAVIVANGNLLHNKLATIQSATVVKLVRQTTDDERLIIQSSINHMQKKTVPVTPLGQLAVFRQWIGDGERADKKSFSALYAGADMDKKDLANLVDQTYPPAILDWAFPELLIVDRLINSKAHGDNGLTFNRAFGMFKRSELNIAAKRAVPTALMQLNEESRIKAEKLAKDTGAPSTFVPFEPITAEEVKALIAQEKEAKGGQTKAERDAKLDAQINSKKSSPVVAALATGIKADDLGAIETLNVEYGALLTLAHKHGSAALVSLVNSAAKLSLNIAGQVLDNLVNMGPDELAECLTFVHGKTFAAQGVIATVQPVADEHKTDSQISH